MSPLDPPASLPVPSTPNPTGTTIVYGILRVAIAAAMGAGILSGTTGMVSNADLMATASTLVLIGTGAWSWLHMRALARHAHDTAVLNAARPAGSLPVQPQ